MLKFSSIIKDHHESWSYGPDVSINPNAIDAVEPKEHRYHSLRPAQHYAYLNSGLTIEVFAGAASVRLPLKPLTGNRKRND